MSADCEQSEEEPDIHDELDRVDAELASVEMRLQELLERQSQLVDRKSQLRRLIDQKEDERRQEKDDKFWNKSDFPWSKSIDDKLNSVFGLSELRPMQRQTMNATMSGEDCLLVMPTGGGKSLCFQLPAVISDGLTLVVSPLVSLMEDQQMALERLNVPSAVLNASSPKELQKFIMEDMVKPNGSLRLLYVTPEKLAKNKRFMNKLEKCYNIDHLSRLVIDEVHCCSQWGHDFRPDYKFLGIMKRQFPKAPILGLTATATTNVLEDVKNILSIPKALVLKASFNRPNLFYEVREKPSTQKECTEAIVSLIKSRFHNQSGIVYCFSRKESEEVAMELSSHGVTAGCYHADMEPKARSEVHRQWLEGRLQAVVATVAFGMGIDKPDVRFVIHHSISKSMENLYQESGRAGRDGKRSDCIVFYRLADLVRQSCMVFTEQTGLSNLHGIANYCIDIDNCRRSVIAGHFGEVWNRSHCADMCDNCLKKRRGGRTEKRDVTRHCADVLSIIDAASVGDVRVTAIKLVDAWYGKGAPGLKVKAVKAPSLAKSTAERILAHMLVKDYLSEDFHFTAYSTICYIKAGSKSRMLRSKTSKIMLDFTTTAPSSSLSSSSSTSKPSPSNGNQSSPQLSSTSNPTPHDPSTSLRTQYQATSVKGKSHPSSTSSSSSSSSTTVPKPKSSASPFSKSTQSSSRNSPPPVSSEAKSHSFAAKSKDKKKKGVVVEDTGQEEEAVNLSDDSDDDKDLNFDDEDDELDCHMVVESHRKQKRLVSSAHHASASGDKIELTKETDPVCVSVSLDSDENDDDDDDDDDDEDFVVSKRRQKRLTISDSDDDNSDKDLLNTKNKSISRLSLAKKKRKTLNDSIVISDDEVS